MFLSLKNVKMNKSFFKDKVNLFKQLSNCFVSKKSFRTRDLQSFRSLGDILSPYFSVFHAKCLISLSQFLLS